MSDIDREAAARAALDTRKAAPMGVARAGVRHGIAWRAEQRHIALNDPATILADIERMRRLEAVVEAASAIVYTGFCTHGVPGGGDVPWHDNRCLLCALQNALAALKEADDDNTNR